MTRHEEENKHLQVLERFVERRKDPSKNSKDELIEAVEFLTLMKEEEGMLLIHNSRYYEREWSDNRTGVLLKLTIEKD